MNEIKYQQTNPTSTCNTLGDRQTNERTHVHTDTHTHIHAYVLFIEFPCLYDLYCKVESHSHIESSSGGDDDDDDGGSEACGGG